MKLVDNFPKQRTAQYLGDQLLRSSTCPALTYGEAQAAESKRNFIHKMGINLKELRESKNNLIILTRVGIINNDLIIKENSELIAIFIKSIETAKSR